MFYVGKARCALDDEIYMPKKSRKASQAKKEPVGKIVIDANKGLVFADEDELFNHFSNDIGHLEKNFFAHKKDTDISLDDYGKFESCLSKLLTDPAEIWLDKESLPGNEVSNFIAEFASDGKMSAEKFYYVGQVYMSGDTPSFVYLHFPTLDTDLVAKYRKGEMVYDRARGDALPGASDGDALSEREPLAEGLYRAMIKVRGESDVPEADFPKYFHLREETIEEPDEIWRSRDAYGIILVNFIKEFGSTENKEEELFYIAVTQEDPTAESHMLLFSFPTKDKSLVERYRHGENMTADEVVQESSH